MTPQEIQAEREKRSKLIADARALLDSAKNDKGEKRDLTQEEEAKYSKMIDDAEKIGANIKREERQLALEREQAESQGRLTDPDPAGRRSEKPKDGPVEFRYTLPSGRERRFNVSGPRATAQYSDVFNRYCSRGNEGLSGDEIRALQADIDASGGYLVVPQVMAGGLIKFVDNAVFVRQRAAVQAPLTAAQSLGAVSLDTDVANPAWTTELGIGSEDSSTAFGKRELFPHPLAKLIKISNTLLRRSSMSAEGLVTERLGYTMAITQENAFLNGTGAQQPLGVFTASDQGVPTSRDVSTGNTTTAITFDGLMEAKYTLKPQYWGASSWTFHRDAVKMLAKIKDGDGQYIWQQNVSLGAPDRLLNLPMDVSEYAPNTFTTGLYVGLICDWSKYWIVDALSMSIQRLVELYAATNQTGFISRTETDGMPVLAEAFVRVKLP